MRLGSRKSGCEAARFLGSAVVLFPRVAALQQVHTWGRNVVAEANEAQHAQRDRSTSQQLAACQRGAHRCQGSVQERCQAGEGAAALLPLGARRAQSGSVKDAERCLDIPAITSCSSGAIPASPPGPPIAAAARQQRRRRRKGWQRQGVHSQPPRSCRWNARFGAAVVGTCGDQRSTGPGRGPAACCGGIDRHGMTWAGEAQWPRRSMRQKFIAYNVKPVKRNEFRLRRSNSKQTF